jgi:uncharacterized protein
MSISAMGIAPTSRASCYLKQLCLQWGEGVDVDVQPAAGQPIAGRIALPLGRVELNAGDMALLITCTPHAAADLGFMQQEVNRHLSRLSRGEGTLALHWGRC